MERGIKVAQIQISKVHKASIDNISICVLTEIMKLLQRIVTALKEIYNIDGYSIMQNGGEFCDFGHAHFHVLPRYKTMDSAGNTRKVRLNVQLK